MPSAAPRQHAVVFELTQRCNHDCLHCYNAWKNELPAPYPLGELGTAETLALLDKLLDETGAELLTLTGGEPLLRPDLFEIVDALAARGVELNLISNGALLDEAAVARLLPDKISLFELPLLSAERGIHDELSARAGAFDAVTAAMAELKLQEQGVIGVFVATRLNHATFYETAELAVALGLDGLMLNRFNPGGSGYKHLEALQLDPVELEALLEQAERDLRRVRAAHQLLHRHAALPDPHGALRAALLRLLRRRDRAGLLHRGSAGEPAPLQPLAPDPGQPAGAIL